MMVKYNPNKLWVSKGPYCWHFAWRPPKPCSIAAPFPYVIILAVLNLALLPLFCDLIDFLQNHDVGGDRYASGALHQRLGKTQLSDGVQPFKQQRREATKLKVQVLQFDWNESFPGNFWYGQQLFCHEFQFECYQYFSVCVGFFYNEFITNYMLYCPVLHICYIFLINLLHIWIYICYAQLRLLQQGGPNKDSNL